MNTQTKSAIKSLVLYFRHTLENGLTLAIKRYDDQEMAPGRTITLARGYITRGMAPQHKRIWRGLRAKRSGCCQPTIPDLESPMRQLSFDEMTEEGSETGIPFLIAIVSDLIVCLVLELLVGLGKMNTCGALLKIGSLTKGLRLAVDNGAKHVLLSAENKRDFKDVLSNVLDKMQIIFYSAPVNEIGRAVEVG